GPAHAAEQGVRVELGPRPHRQRMVCGVGVAAEARVELPAAVEADRDDIQRARVVDAAGLVVDGRAQYPDGGAAAPAARGFVRGHAAESAGAAPDSAA